MKIHWRSFSPNPIQTYIMFSCKSSITDIYTRVNIIVRNKSQTDILIRNTHTRVRLTDKNTFQRVQFAQKIRTYGAYNILNRTSCKHHIRAGLFEFVCDVLVLLCRLIPYNNVTHDRQSHCRT